MGCGEFATFPCPQATICEAGQVPASTIRALMSNWHGTMRICGVRSDLRGEASSRAGALARESKHGELPMSESRLIGRRAREARRATRAQGLAKLPYLRRKIP